MADNRLVLIYDGECEFCEQLAAWVRRRDRRGRVEVRANQDAGVIERFGLARAEVDRASWAIEPGGRRFEGAAGISRVLRELGGGWRVLGSLYLLAPARWLEDRYYRRVAQHRAWW